MAGFDADDAFLVLSLSHASLSIPNYECLLLLLLLPSILRYDPPAIYLVLFAVLLATAPSPPSPSLVHTHHVGITIDYGLCITIFNFVFLLARTRALPRRYVGVYIYIYI